MKLLHWGMLVAAIGVGTYAWSRWATVENPDAARATLRDEQERVRIKAEADPSCPKETPIRVTIQNGADRKLTSVDFHLAIFEEGQADDLGAAQPDDSLAAPIAPFGSAARCRAFPKGLPKHGARYFFRPEKRGMATFASAK